ncbi:hypothetical protein TWF106_005648 [Orbilia oligospora]|uniref:F-box domain-containing protein n=1 Tax=Orbilia oligospora TaxID=2813651 RepID=A0A6G1M9Y3_ORBOL|nr:hypothetical protein TWF679_004894 [Orbilia oligospora]KAF3222231.1 hypothetical protein TWF106_005648 [Orbilia oligospora]KAF3225172.1 hypothetical protein TWF191_005462 [Orbilia oligospora]KAF3249169.1 hypothetical protein TWF192_006111 [Orbilia oligospora]
MEEPKSSPESKLAESKLEPNSESKLESKLEPSSESRPESTSESKPELNPVESNTDSKPRSNYGSKVESKVESNPESNPVYRPFNGLPPEVAICIFKCIPKEDLRNFARCSKWLYNGSFPYRFNTVILNPDAGEGATQNFDRPLPSFLWEDGLFYAETRKRITAVSFEKTYSWRDHIICLRTRFCGRRLLPDNVFTRLCNNLATLKHFPSLQRLHISYEIPSAAENNVFLAILNGINEHGSKFRESLEILDIMVFKTFESPGEMRDGDPAKENERYERMYSALSPANQEFLGKKIPDEEMGKLVRSKISALPQLMMAEISVNGVPWPFTSKRFHRIKRLEFYFIPFELSPLLRYLTLNTAAPSSMFTTYNILKVQDPHETKGSWEIGPQDSNISPSKTLSISDFTGLMTTIYADRKLAKFEEWVLQRFPKLVCLYICMAYNPATQYHILPQSFDILMQLKDLRIMTLPWPRSPAVILNPGGLASMVRKWKVSGMRKIEMVTFEGIRRLQPVNPEDPLDLRNWEKTRIQFSFVPDEVKGWELAVGGDYKPSQFQDYVDTEA